ncbi:MAG: DUF3040 domain-containing protein [Acidimicrobiales bacterium]|nr:DUF3040 domain-containing protein [Acidimicrobiales bacterium]
MPLSEDEQRILSEIEQQLYETDPALAREVSSTTVYTAAFRGIRLALFGFLGGVVFLWFTLGTSYWLAFLGFLIMLASTLWFERNARKLGRVGLEQMTNQMRGAGLRDYLGSTGSKMRDRMRRDEDDQE